MKKTLIVLISLALVSATFGAEMNTTSPRMAEAMNQAAVFNLQSPVPVCVGPNNPGAVLLRKACAQTNGVSTAFHFETADSEVLVYILIQTDRNVRPEVRWYVGKDQFFAGYNRYVHTMAYGAWLYDATIQGNGTFVQVFSDGFTRDLEISNELLGADGSGFMNMAFIAVRPQPEQGGDLVETFPSPGKYVSVPTTMSLSLSPATGTVLYNIVGRGTRFDFVAEVSSTDHPSQTTLIWFADGNNVTDIFSGQAVEGYLQPKPVSEDQPIVHGFTKRIDYQMGYIPETVTFEVYAISPRGIATARVTYTRHDILEPVQPPKQ